MNPKNNNSSSKRRFSIAGAFLLVWLTALTVQAKESSVVIVDKKKIKPSLVSLIKRYRIYRNITYVDKPESDSQKLDIYVPKSASNMNPVPIVIWIHGGGWRSGDKRFGPFVPLLRKDYAVASINYRLSQEAKFPAQIHDCKRAVIWVKKNAEKYNIDCDRVGVWGASAGGHLSALLGTTTGSDDLEKEKETDELNSDVDAVCDWFGPTDLLKTIKYDSGKDKYVVHPMVQQLLGVEGPRLVDAARQASPTTYITEKVPPTFIVHGDKDKLVSPEQSEILYKKLKAKKIDVRYETVSGGHGFPGFGLKTRNKVVDFFNRKLRAKSSGR